MPLTLLKMNKDDWETAGEDFTIEIVGEILRGCDKNQIVTILAQTLALAKLSLTDKVRIYQRLGFTESETIDLVSGECFLSDKGQLNCTEDK